MSMPGMDMFISSAASLAQRGCVPAEAGMTACITVERTDANDSMTSASSAVIIAVRERARFIVRRIIDEPKGRATPLAHVPLRGGAPLPRVEPLEAQRAPGGRSERE